MSTVSLHLCLTYHWFAGVHIIFISQTFFPAISWRNTEERIAKTQVQATQQADLCTSEARVAINPVSNEASQQQYKTSTCEAEDRSKLKLTTSQTNEVEANSKVPHTISLHMCTGSQ